MKKIVALLLVALMLSTAVFAEDIILIAPNPNAGKTVTVRVESPEETLFCGPVTIAEGASVLDVAEAAFAQADIDYTVAVSPYGGSYITQAAGLQEGALGGYEGWLYYVDGVSPAVSMSLSTLQGGEEVVLIYTDFDVLVPILEATRDHKGLVTLSLTADVTTYDENWNATVTRQPVTDAAITVDGQVLTTDASGKVLLSEALSAKDAVAVQVEKKNAVGLPGLIPFAPDYTLALAGVEKTMPFADLEESQWYTPYVLKMYDLGVVNGLPGGLFGPTDTVTRGQVAKMLFEMSGGIPVNYLMTFTDVNQEAWYAEGVRWCAAMGIAQGAEGKFSPDAPITRQDLAVMLMRYQENVVKTQLPERAEAPAFLDNEDIASYAAEAIYKLQKAGIIQGNEGKFNPLGNASRGELCKMLSGLVVSD